MKASAYHFFLRHASFSYGMGETRRQGRIRCAKEAAQAERDATRFGLTFTWQSDDDPDLSWMDKEDRENVREVLGCVARTPDGRVVASLWGIVDPSREYGRVVEAELAQEALATVGQPLV